MSSLTNPPLQSLHLLWEHSPDSMFIIQVRDGRYYLHDYNPVQKKAFPEGVDMQQPLDAILPAEMYRDIQARYQHCIASREPMSYEEPGFNDDYWSTLLIPLVNDDGKVEFIAGVSRNIKDLKQAEQRMRKAMEQANYLNTQYEKLNAELEHKVLERTQELALKNKELEQLYITDRLTGLYNRYKLDRVLAAEMQRVERYPHPFGVILLDIDDFKIINDTHGHQVGDQTLVRIATLLKENTRATDVAGRWGGEEFLILCAETDMNGARHLAEKLRKAIAGHRFALKQTITASFGVAVREEIDSAEQLISKADTALYKAKQNGRNRVEIYQPNQALIDQ
ncbi:diguanylate cyclase [Thiomicrospira microaerophila]|uniref:sensor domain-containing diguanylate cyclase n=1 Tax=Thiomicrospira microaerophila TaxID=406020 RepID=UPI00200F91C1|nr:sensor domain-containing diguanylate cyclase [Thiomicrospira microaerophila]UQB42242.1 diguanylate cyclase [Thiomicrospira microaerophila]